ncbi:hydroxymethylglutaryl-CoA reductase [Nocardia brasiliensis]|uniref:hydroxymethylglutaryl-CoA reductase n=1 Tax=Nocardia brasiliensis TaxID=37326 RepID=UPI002454295C|nr:hydroxymethylglutaryl-CoA reductase [Nocardia brasiliensis]
MNDLTCTPIPLAWVGPIRLSGTVAGEIRVPLATYESPLWPSVGRGARVSRAVADGIVATVVDDRMTRSVLLEADDAATAVAAAHALEQSLPRLQSVVAGTSRFARLIGLHHQIVGNLLYLRFEFTTGDASGHNMCTKAADHLIGHIVSTHPGLRYESVSANFCMDKKLGAVNAILGRGKNVVTEILVPAAVVTEQLRTTATAVARLNLRKNLIGTIVSGGIRSANAHYANMLLAFYLATGQDAANIVEGSQGITHAEDRNGDLYFSCTLPNLIVGTHGNGKHLPHVEAALSQLSDPTNTVPGHNARRLAVLAAATVLCGELSLLAAQTNPGELMAAHTRLERPTPTSRKPVHTP